MQYSKPMYGGRTPGNKKEENFWRFLINFSKKELLFATIFLWKCITPLQKSNALYNAPLFSVGNIRSEGIQMKVCICGSPLIPFLSSSFPMPSLPSLPTFMERSSHCHKIFVLGPHRWRCRPLFEVCSIPQLLRISPGSFHAKLQDFFFSHWNLHEWWASIYWKKIRNKKFRHELKTEKKNDGSENSKIDE